MLVRKLALFLITSGAAAKAWTWWRKNRQEQAEQRRQRDLTHQVARWEDEGGNPATPVTAGAEETADATASSTRRRARKAIDTDRTAPEAG